MVRDLQWLAVWPLFLLLAFPFLLAFFFFLFRFRQKAAALFEGNIRARSRALYVTYVLLILLSLFCALIALMGPVGYGHYVQVQEKKQAPLFALVDLSYSQSVRDMESEKSRLEFSKEVLDELLGRFTGKMVGLFTFAKELEILSPVTPDPLYPRLVLSQIAPKREGTDLARALREVKKEILSQGISQGTLVVFTDGGDLPMIKSETFSPLQLIIVGTGSLKGGDLEGVPGGFSRLNQEGLLGLTSQAGGYYFEGEKRDPILLVDRLEEMIRGGQQVLLSSDGEGVSFEHFFFIPLFCASLALLGAKYLPQAILCIVPFFLLEGVDQSALNLEQAGLYLLAEEQLERELKQSKSESERELLRFNLARVKMRSEKWQEALELLETSREAPFLKKDQTYNKAYIFYMVGLQSADLGERVDFLKRAAFLFFQLGEEGRGAYRQTMVQLDQAIRAYDAAKLTTLSFEDGIVILRRGVKDLIEQSDQLDSYASFFSLFKKELEGWLPLFERLVEEDPSLEKAYLEYLGVLDDKESAKRSLSSVLNQLNRIETTNQKIRELQAMIALFSAAAIENPLRFGHLLSLQLELEKLSPSQEISLREAVGQFKSGNEPSARAELMFTLQQLIGKLDAKTSEERLKHLIAQNKWLIEMDRFSEVKKSRKFLLKEAELFVQSVKEEQSIKGCNCSPWDIVLPLFFQGREQLIAGRYLAGKMLWEEALAAFHEKQEEKKTPVDLLQRVIEMHFADKPSTKEKQVESSELLEW